MGKLTHHALDFDGDAEIARITEHLRASLRALGRRGLVVAVSGGIDSSVSAALAVKAIGAKRVLCLLMPERDSSSAGLERGLALVRALGVDYAIQDITAPLDAIGCYDARDEAVRSVFPDYAPDWKYKIAISGGLQGRYNVFSLIVQRPGSDDAETDARTLPGHAFFQIVAATNYKQRIRKSIEYFHADRLRYAVIGTPNRLEFDQGFFVKNGDGAADIKPIAHLYKTQVYHLARALGLPDDICHAVPTTDTYSLRQGQDEFYFALPYEQMDYALWAHDAGIPAVELAAFLGVEPAVAEYVYRDITAKRNATRYLHHEPMLVPTTSHAGR